MNHPAISMPESCEYPTLWGVTEQERFIPPFGEVIHMRIEQVSRQENPLPLLAIGTNRLTLSDIVY